MDFKKIYDKEVKKQNIKGIKEEVIEELIANGMTLCDSELTLKDCKSIIFKIYINTATLSVSSTIIQYSGCETYIVSENITFIHSDPKTKEITVKTVSEIVEEIKELYLTTINACELFL